MFFVICYLLLILGLLNLFVYRRGWIWGPLVFLSLVFAYHDGIVDLHALAPIALIFGLNLLLKNDLHGWIRFVIVVMIIGCSAPLLFHFFPGFHNPIVMKGIKLSKNSAPYTQYLNFDKPFTGLFTIALLLPRLKDRHDYRRAFLASIPLIFITLLILTALAFLFHFLKFEPKFPSAIWMWMLINLFLVVIPEEGFFRGLIQREIVEALPRDWGPAIGIIAASLLFALPHAAFIPNWEYLTLTVVAGIGYGTIYHLTQAIESAILCHFLVNLIHFVFFTYPFAIS